MIEILNSTAMAPFTASVVFIFGMLLGSFLNVCIYRIPLKKSIVFPPSSCTKCGHLIKWYENIPVLSWLFLRGRCSGCKEKISMIYPVIELLNGLLYLFAFLRFGVSIQLIFVFYFISAMIVTAMIDFKTQFVYPAVVLPLVVTGLAGAYFSNEMTIYQSFFGILAGAGILLISIAIFYLVTRKIGMGLGDVYILGAIGAYSGPWKIPLILLFASCAGTVFFLTAKILFKKKRIAENVTMSDLNTTNEKDLENAIYFGPFLALAGVAVVLAPSEILNIIFPTLF
ncbi:MAG TPA: prepilin peptidase [bacterium]|nr:prepilin peptidase [bacterium]HPS28741.1 prepilin peptidase [bacterium]